MRRLLAGVLLCALALALAFPAGAHALPAHPALDGLLADTWCGAERTIADKDSGPRLPYYKVVYAYASDVGDRFPSFAGAIARYTKAAAAKVAMFSDKTIRFDRDTSCGPRYLDVRTLALPDTAGYYKAGVTDRVFGTLERLLPADGPRRNYLVYVDLGLRDEYYGFAQPYQDDRPGPDNESNTHAAPAIAVLVGGAEREFFATRPDQPPGQPARVADLVLQEILHNLGAVQFTAPHSSGEWHCWQAWDVMCYQSRPDTASLQFDCALASDSVDVGVPLDCGADDYFNPNPAPGSYLATHWNTYDSVYLCPVADCGPAARWWNRSVDAAPTQPRAPSTVVSLVAPTHVVVGPTPARPLVVVARHQPSVSLRRVLRRGLRVRFTTRRSGIQVRATLGTKDAPLAVRTVRARTGGSSVLFRLSRSQRRRLARHRRVVFRVALTAQGSPATATVTTIVARRPS